MIASPSSRSIQPAPQATRQALQAPGTPSHCRTFQRAVVTALLLLLSAAPVSAQFGVNVSTKEFMHRQEPSLGAEAKTTVTVTVTNPSVTESLRVDSASLGFLTSGTVDVADQYSVIAPGLPVILPPSANQAILFQVLPRPSAVVLQGITMTAAVTATDLGSMSASSATSLTDFAVQPGATVYVGQADGFSDLRKLKGLSEPSDVWSDGTRLLVADTRGNRILAWRSYPTTNHQIPDFVLGQPGFNNTGSNTGGRSASTMDDPEGVFSDGTKLIVADKLNNRVLIWNSFPDQTGQAADLILGQPNATSSTANNSGLSATSLSGPEGVWTDGTRLLVVDTANNRVLGWSTFPTDATSAADLVLGQGSFTSAGPGTTTTTLRTPLRVWSDGTRVYVTDSRNARVMGWSSFPSGTGPAANFVLGQSDFVTGTPGTASASTISSPDGVSSDGTRLLVSDSGNNRTLIWNSLPTTTSAPADLVTGQSSFVSNQSNQGGADPMAGTHNSPRASYLSSSGLAIADALNHRVLLFPALPSSNGESASVVLGHSDFISSNQDDGGPLDASRLSNSSEAPFGVDTDGTRLVVSDIDFNRVLVWNSLPTSSLTSADVVVGQPDFSSTGSSLSSTGVAFPADVATDGTRLAVADAGNNRVLIWNSIPATNGQAADVVLGQNTFSTDASGLSTVSLNFPGAVEIAGTKLLVLDVSNERILIWNTIPSVNGQAADVVVGQVDFNSAAAGTTSSSLDSPFDVAVIDGKLYVNDGGNNRVLVWDSIPVSNGQAADRVLGQPDFTSSAPNAGQGFGLFGVEGPLSVTGAEDLLLVSESGSSRILAWRPLPTATFQPGTSVMGQVVSTSIAGQSLSPFTANTVDYMSMAGDRLWIAQTSANRIAGFDLTQADPRLVLTSVRTTAANVSQGQSGVNVTMEVSNPGANAANISQLALSFASSEPTDRTTEYVVTPAGPPSVLASGATTTFQFTVGLSSSSTTGTITIDGSVTASDALNSLDLSAARAASTTAWTVQTPATVSILAIEAAPALVSQGQSGLLITMTVQNTGQAAANTATASLILRSGNDTWVEVSTVTTPPPRTLSRAAFDPNRGKVVMFGGLVQSTSAKLGDTWEFDGTSWAQINTTTSPSPRHSHHMVFDGQRNRMVLFGGAIDGSPGTSDETWEYDGTDWALISPATSPPMRSGHRMVFDSRRGRTVMHGGNASIVLTQPPFLENVEYSDVWGFDGSSWTQTVTQTSPPARSNPGMAYDPIRGKTVRFGGFGGTPPPAAKRDETWEYDGTSWTEIFPAAKPTARSFLDMTYDSASGRVLLFGGQDKQGAANIDVADTWEFDGTSWSQLPPTSTPPPRRGHIFSYDSLRDRSIIFSGSVDSDAQTGTWELDTDSRITEYATSPSGGNPASIAGGATVQYSFTVAVNSDATTGSIDLAGYASAVDGNSGAVVFDNGTATKDSFTVQTPAQLSIAAISISPSLVSRGQTGIAVTMSVQNTGEATASVSSAGLTFNGITTGYTVTPSGGNPATVAGGAMENFTFTVDVGATAATGMTTVDGTISATDGNSGADASDTGAAAPDSWTAQTAAVLAITSVSTTPTSVSHGQTGVTVSMTVQNTGEASANVSSGQLTFGGTTAGYFISPPITLLTEFPTSLSGGASSTFDFTVDITSGAATGVVTINGTISGTDSNSGNDASDSNGADSPDSWAVQTPAALVVASISTTPVTVSRGQTGVGVTMRVSNTGLASASIATAVLSFNATATGFNSVASGLNTTVLVGGGSTDLQFTVDVGASAPLGATVIDGTVTATDVNFGAAANDLGGSAVTDSWTVQIPGQISVDSVTAVETEVSQGETGIAVQLALSNSGEAGLDLTAATLSFTSTGAGIVTADYTVAPSGTHPAAIAGGGSVNLDFTVSVGSGATTGTILLDGQASGTDKNSGTLSAVGNASATDSWITQTPSRLEVVSIVTGPGRVSRGQAGLTVLMTVQNRGEADGVMLVPSLKFVAGGGDVTGEYSIQLQPGNPTETIVGGASKLATFLVAVGTGATTGTVTIDGQVTGSDANTPVGPTLDAGADSTDSWTVEEPGLLGLRSLATPNDALRGTTFTAALPITNSGGATILVSSATLTWSTTGLQSTEVSTTSAIVGGTLIAAGQTVNLNFEVDVPLTVAVGNALATATVSGHDTNSLSPLSAASSPVGVMPIRNNPPTADAGQAVTGTASLQVNVDGSGSFDGPLAGSTEGDTLVYSWRLLSRPSGSSLTTASFTTNQASGNGSTSLVPDRKGVYSVGLVVNDSHDDSTLATTTVTILNSSPAASAGPDRLIAIGSAAQLDASATTDIDAEDVLLYTWSFTSLPAGSQLTDSAIQPNGDATAVSPSFIPDVPGTYVIRLSVGDGTTVGIGSVNVQVSNTPPTAEAGQDRTVTATRPVTLDGSASADAEGAPLNYAWSFLSLPALSNVVPTSLAPNNSPSASSPSFRPDQRGLYRIELAVSDGFTVTSDTVDITVKNDDPLAFIATPADLPLGQTAVLDGRLSNDPEGGPITYSWALTAAPAGSTRSTTSLTPNNSSSAGRTSFVPDTKGTYALGLTVSDGVYTSVSAAAQLNVVNFPPVARTRQVSQTLPLGSTFTLDGSGSTDRNPNDQLIFGWTLLNVPSGSQRTASSIQPNNSTTSSLANFTPDVPGSYTIQLRVDDGDGGTSTANSTLVASNGAPIARVASPVTGSLAARAALDGSASTDQSAPGGLTYRWSLTGKPAGSNLSSSSIAPNNSSGASRTLIQPDIKGTYNIQLSVDDGFLTSSAAVVLNVPNAPPVASLPLSASVSVDGTLLLDGTGSRDPDQGDSLTYSWQLAAAPAASPLGANTIDTSFLPPGLARFSPDTAGTYRIHLTVSDSAAASQPAEIVVVATPEVTVPTVVDLRPGAVKTTTTSPISVLGASFTGFTAVSLRGPIAGAGAPGGALTPVSGQFVDDSRVDMTLPADLPVGLYEAVVSAAGLISTSSSVVLSVSTPDPIQINTGSNPILSFGNQNDADPNTPGIQAQVQLSGNNLQDGQTLNLNTQGTSNNKRRLKWAPAKQIVSATVINGVARFPAITLELGATFVIQILDAATGEQIALAAASQGGPPAAIVTIGVTNGGGPQSITLDASESRGENGPLLYRWALVSSPTGADSLDSLLPVTTYRARRAGAYSLRLNVSDARAVTVTATFDFTIVDVPPGASAGPDRRLILPDILGRIPSSLTGTEISLDGRGSSDANGDSLAYLWTLLESPANSTFVAARDIADGQTPVAKLSFSTQADAEGVFVDAGEYLFLLTTSDTAGQKATDTVRLIVLDPENLVPDADAGLDRIVNATLVSTAPLQIARDIPDPIGTTPGATVDFVRLDGRESVDPNVPPRPLIYSWTVVSVPPGSAITTLTSSTTAFPSFRPDRAGNYRFRLVVDNGPYDSSPDETGVLVNFATLNRAPTADAALEDRRRNITSRTSASPIQVIAGLDRVHLVGSLSSDPDPGDSLTYLWQQTGGPTATLAPGATSADVSVVPVATGLYSFRLRVTDSSGLPDTSDLLQVTAVTAQDTPPTLSVAATSTATTVVGQDFDPEDVTAEPNSLRVRINDEVVLKATALDPDVGVSPLNQGLEIDFKQVAGPTVLLTTSPSANPLISEARFSPTTSRVHVFQVTARQLDDAGIDTGVVARRDIRVVVDSDTNGVPVANLGLFAFKDIPDTCQEIALSGIRSADQGPNATSSLLYRWVQTSGPPVNLSNPYSSVVTFVAPDFTDNAPRQFSFSLFVDDGNDRSEPDTVSMVFAPDSQRRGKIPLTGGINLVSPPLDPGGDNPFRIRDLLTQSEADFAVILTRPTDGTRPRFQVINADFGGAGDRVRGSDGFLLVRPGNRRATSSVSGRRWEPGSSNRRLLRGMNFVGYPRGHPTGEDAERLAQRSGASWIIRSVDDGFGRSKFQIFLPGLTPSFLIEEGKAYIIAVPASRTVVLPGCQ